MANGIRIDDLDATLLPSRDHVVPAMKDGLTVKLTVGQILNLLEKVLDPDEVGSKALFAALNLSDLDDPAQARENLGATEVGDGLFTAASKAAGRSAIDALGPDETPDKAFRRGNILGEVTESSGVPTGALFEYGSNANGEYVRWADGTQICVKRMSFPGAVDTAVGSIFLSSAKGLGSWPAAFVATPHRTVFQRGAFGLYSGSTPTETSAGEVLFWRPSSTASIANPDVDIIGIGRWF